MLRFFAIEQGMHDGWQCHFVLATSPEDAVARYTKRILAQSYYQSEYYKGNTTEARVFETEFDDFGVLQNVGSATFQDEPILKVEIPD